MADAALQPSNASFGQVNAAVQAANDGETVRIPAGTATWGDGTVAGNQILNIRKDIQLIGAGMDDVREAPQPGSATIITVRNTTGAAIDALYNGTANLARISGTVFEITVNGSNYLINCRGRAYRRRVGSDVLGGLRLDHLRFRLASASLAATNVIQWGGTEAGVTPNDWMNGSIDWNFWDYPLGAQASESNNFGSAGSPLGARYSGTGQYQWEQDYTYGNGDDTELNVIWVEDNIFHRTGHNWGTLCGGGRFVYRYNTSWGSLNTHGIDGGNMGPASNEWYNNWWHDRGTLSLSMCNTRGGASVIFNNRMTTPHGDIASQTYRDNSAFSNTIGPATGRNWLDQNYRGSITFNGFTFNPISTPADSRMGSIYAQGTNAVVSGSGQTRQYTLNMTGIGLGPTSNKWNDFVLVSLDATGNNGTYGDQGAAGVNTSEPQAVIQGSARINDNSCTVTVTKGGNRWITGPNSSALPVNITNWEIRRVQSYFCNPGSGKVPKSSSGIRNLNTAAAAEPPNPPEKGGYYFLDPPVTIDGQARNKYWVGQVGFGLWQWANKSRNCSVGGANPGTFASITIPANLAVMGGWHNDADGPPTYRKNDKYGGTTSPSNPYPTVANTTVTRRIGAHWQAPGTDPLTNQPWAEGEDLPATGPGSTVWGAAYPNPVISASPSTPAITSADHINAIPGDVIDFQITTQNFSPAVTGYNFQIGNFTGSGISLNTSTGKISGTAAGPVHDYAVTLRASNGVDHADQSFTLKITAAPSGVSLTSPTVTTFTAPATITFQASATAASGSTIDQIDYYYGGTNLIQSIDATAVPSPYTYSWTNVAAGSYALTVKATDNLGFATISSPAKTITVSDPVADLSAPTIVVSG